VRHVTISKRGTRARGGYGAGDFARSHCVRRVFDPDRSVLSATRNSRSAADILRIIIVIIIIARCGGVSGQKEIPARDGRERVFVYERTRVLVYIIIIRRVCA